MKRTTRRLFWSQNDHMIIFDDTEGEEKVELRCSSRDSLRCDNSTHLSAIEFAEKTITEYSDGNIEWEAKETIQSSVKRF